MRPEQYVETYLVRQVERRGGYCYKLSFPNRPGAPDRMAMFPQCQGRVYFIETKSATGRLSTGQEAIHALFAKCHVTVEVIRSREEVDAWLGRILGAAK